MVTIQATIRMLKDDLVYTRNELDAARTFTAVGFFSFAALSICFGLWQLHILLLALGFLVMGIGSAMWWHRVDIKHRGTVMLIDSYQKILRAENERLQTPRSTPDR